MAADPLVDGLTAEGWRRAAGAYRAMAPVFGAKDNARQFGGNHEGEYCEMQADRADATASQLEYETAKGER